MEAEVVAFGAFYKELMPIIDLVDEVGSAVGLSRKMRRPTCTWLFTKTMLVL